MKKYIVIGNPIEHSLSPLLHNHWIKEKNLKAIYDKKKSKNDELKEIISSIKNKNISGANVTVPFKNEVIKYLDKLHPEAEKTQSVNTIYLEDNFLIGANTDIKGFELAMTDTGYDVSQKNILILGAGGVVPSIIFALKKMHASEITVSNRTKANAEGLKNMFGDLKIIEWGQSSSFDLVINATSLGLKSDDKIDFDYSNVGKNKFFYDVIYNPEETDFLKRAKELNHKTENGLKMFLYQAAEAFKIWHGFNPDINESTFGLFKK